MVSARGVAVNARQGFTLIELVVAIAIIGILMALGLPSFMTWLRNVQIRNAAETMQNGLQFARSEALRRNERVTFWTVSLTDPKVMDNSCARSDAGISWVVSRDDPASLCATAVSDVDSPRIIAKHAGGDGNRKTSITALDAGGAAATCVTFNGFGRVETKCSDASASNPIARLTIVSSETDANTRPLEVRIGSGGVIRMCDPNVTTTSDPRYC